jgi:hypothetical protein
MVQYHQCSWTNSCTVIHMDSWDSTTYIHKNGVFVRESAPMFLVSDDLKKIVPCSLLSSLEMLIELGYSDLTQLEEVTHNISKHEVINVVVLFFLFAYILSILQSPYPHYIDSLLYLHKILGQYWIMILRLSICISLIEEAIITLHAPIVPGYIHAPSPI